MLHHYGQEYKVSSSGLRELQNREQRHSAGKSGKKSLKYPEKRKKTTEPAATS
jgi:hypothetical protein